MASTPSAISHDNVFNSAGLAIGLGIGVGATVIVFIIFGVGAMIWYRHKRAHTCNCSKVADLFPNVRSSEGDRHHDMTVVAGWPESPLKATQSDADITSTSRNRSAKATGITGRVDGGVHVPAPLDKNKDQSSHSDDDPRLILQSLASSDTGLPLHKGLAGPLTP
ncbi:hypothetical protein CcaverHIS641_0605660 [Cutaneotrichosporon cavernicola]|nr:hypothetical protein CcaverHIS641_0605660 [Cutaneotrichosporon cavernicola]